MSIFTRKSKQIYKWDDSFAVSLVRDLDPPSTPTWSWVCDSDHYALILACTVHFRLVAGIRGTYTRCVVYDASEEILQSNMIQHRASGTYTLHFNTYSKYGHPDEYELLRTVPMPNTFYLTPGQIFRFEITFPLVGDRIHWITLLMKSWNLR